MKIMKIKVYCVYWGKADENPIDQESWKNLTGERSLRIASLTACVRLRAEVESCGTPCIRDRILRSQLSPTRGQSRMGHYAEKRG